MGLLDQLKSEVESKKGEEELRAEQIKQRETYHREHIIPCLKECYSYFDELLQSVNYLKLRVMADYDIAGFGRIDQLVQTDYRVKVDSTENTRQVALRFKCVRDDTIGFSITGEKPAERQISYMLAHHLDFQVQKIRSKISADMVGRFSMKCEIPVYVSIDADVENSLVTLTITNFEGLGQIRHRFSPEKVDRDFLDTLGAYLLRKTDSFMKYEVSEDTLARIRQNLQEYYALNEVELGDDEVEQDSSVTESIRARMGKIFQKVDPGN